MLLSEKSQHYLAPAMQTRTTLYSQPSKAGYMAVVSNGQMSDGFHIGMNMLQDRDREGIFLCSAGKPKGEWDLLLKAQKREKKS